MFQGFIHTALLWGTLLAAVPLLIHLFNRQRHKPLRWAAMRYMMAAYRRTRRRAQLENLLLLLLRMAAVALLALALSRPFTGAESPLSPLTESRRDLVLVLDVSASTGYRANVRSVLERILERAREVLEEFDATRGDRVRLVSAGAQPVLLSSGSPQDAVSMLGTLSEPTDQPLDLAAVLAEVVGLAEDEAAGTDRSSLEVRLLTDLQRGTFEPGWKDLTAPASGEEDEGADAAMPALLRSLDRLDELGVRVGVEDLGGGELVPPNLGIVDVAPVGEVHGPGLATEIGVRVRNFGPQARAGVRVALEVDGVRQPSRTLDLEPGSAIEVVFRVAFAQPGSHALVAHLEGDRLAWDDRRASVIEVPAPLRVLLVNGDPHADIDRDEVGYLRAVLEPQVDDTLEGLGPGSAPFEVRVVDALSFGASEGGLADRDVVVLANVGSLSQRIVKALEEHVASGGVLLVTLGDRVADESALESLNARLWNATETALLPARLLRAVEVPSRREAYYRCSWFEEEHPALRFFSDERWRPLLTEVPVYGFVASRAIAQARVLARLDDDAKSPLLVEREFGRGRVLLWTTSIDRDWSRVAESPGTLIPLVHELLRWATRANRPTRNVRVGETIALEVDGFPRAASVLAPDQSRRPLDGEPTELARGLWTLPPIGPLERAGLWRVEHEGGRVPFAVGIEPAEGDLERIGLAALAQQHRAWRPIAPGAGGSEDEDDGPERGELWRPLALAALLALVAETLWAAWIGRGRRRT